MIEKDFKKDLGKLRSQWPISLLILISLFSQVFLVLVTWPLSLGQVWAKVQEAALILAGEEDITIISADDYGCSLEFTLPPFQVEKRPGPDGIDYQRIVQKGMAWTDQPGYPELPVKSLCLLVPSSGQIQIKVLEQIYESLTDCLFYPLPRPILTEEGLPSTELAKDQAAYESSGFFPEQVIAIDQRAFLGDQAVARIKIYPFQWHPKTKELRYCRKIRFLLNFESPLSPLSSLSPLSPKTDQLSPLSPKTDQLSYLSPKTDQLSLLSPKTDQQPGRMPQGLANRLKTLLASPASTDQAMRLKIESQGLYRLTLMNNRADVNGDGELTPIDAQSVFEAYLEMSPTCCGLTSEEAGRDLNGDGECTPRDSLEIYRQCAGIFPNACSPLFGHPAKIKLLSQGHELACQVVTQKSDRLEPGDYLEFYGQTLETLFTGNRVYKLCSGEIDGLRINQVDGEVTGQAERVDSFLETIHGEENNLFWSLTPEAPTKDYWFWEKITAPQTGTYSLDLPSPLLDQGEAKVRIGFRGRSTALPYPNHHTIISLNSTLIGDAFWEGDGEYVQEITISANLLQAGTNTITIRASGDTGSNPDIIYLNWLEIDYQRSLEAVGDTLTFVLSGEKRVQAVVRNLTEPQVKIYDITDPQAVKEVIKASIQPDGQGYQAVFEVQVSGRQRYMLLAAKQIKQVELADLWSSVGLKDTADGADQIMITAAELATALEPLAQFRRQQGLRVKLVRVEDIYNEFNEGMVDPATIRDFLAFAYEYWPRPAPTSVLLVGDATIDYRDYLATGKKSRVPAHFSMTTLGLTPDDNWYVCVQGEDPLPDMQIGRIPAQNPEVVASLVNKIISFEESTTLSPARVLLVADNNEAGYEQVSNDLISYLPSEFSADKVYLRLFGTVDQATQAIISGFNQGAMIVNYLGHGSTTNWAGELVFESTDLASLTNEGHLPLVLAMTCLNAYFANPFSYSLAEEFVIASGKGAIACFASSGLIYHWEHEILNKEVLANIFEHGENSLGSITTKAKINAYAQGASEDMLRVFTLLGDPAVRLKGWE